jgi:tetratricopeptide (TPR) repeat protein
MLSTATTPVSLAHRLSQPTGDIVIIANVRDESQRIALQQLTRTIRGNPRAGLLGDALIDLTATVSVNEPTVVRVTAEFTDRWNASGALRQLNQAIRSARTRAHENIGISLKRGDTVGTLVSMAFDGVSMSFPDQNSPTAEARESLLLSIIDDSLDNIHVESDDNILTVEFTQPASVSRSLEAAQVAVANMEEELARGLFSRERFDLSDEMYQRVTNRFPHVPQAWFRRAHQLAYNMSFDFDGYENRYAWVRRGIDVLLDGAEQNPDPTDLTWMTARFIGRKIGDSDERAAYRQLFSQDERLHKRIAKIIDVEKARSPDKKVDNWLVARLLFEHCVDRHEKSRASSTIPPVLFFSRTAATQARYAHALSESGHWDEARRAWKEAEQLHNELGEETISVGTSERIRLNDLESRLVEFGPDDASVQQLQAARKRIQYDYWLMRCKLEQTANVQLAWKLSQKAAEHARRAEPETAYDLYRQSLQALSEVHKRHPKQMSQFAGEFQQVAAGYRKVAELLDETDEQPLAFILTLIEQSKPVSRFPLVDLQSAGHGDSPR